MSRGYSHAFLAGQRAAHLWGAFAISPFWRGWKYRKAWANGYRMGRLCR